MAEQNINIRISLKDEFSGAIAKVTERIEDIGKTVERTGKEINAMGSKLTMLGGIITGGFTIALKQVAEYSPEVNRVFQDIGNSFLELERIIADAVLPIFREISNVITKVTDAFRAMDPQLRQTILQILLISGIVMTFGGIALKIIGSVIFIFGNLLQAINPVTIAIAAVAGAVLLMVYQWDNIRQYVMPIIAGLEQDVLMLAIGWEKVALAMTHVLAFGAALAGKQDLAVYFEEQAIGIENTIAGLEEKIVDTFSGGGWAGALDSGIEKVRSFMDAIKGLFGNTTQSLTTDIQNFIDEFSKAFDAALVKVNNLGQQSAQIIIGSIQQLSKGFGDSVANMLVKGKNFGESMKAVFEQMAISFISGVIQMITQWAIFQAIQAAFMPLMVSLGSAAAMALAAIWAPVAAMVSLATLGGNAGPAAAALTSTTALAYAMSIPKFAEGGIVTRPTLALIGERGPEAIVPLSRSNSYRTTNIHIEINNPNVRSMDDVDDLTREIERRIARGTSR